MVAGLVPDWLACDVNHGTCFRRLFSRSLFYPGTPAVVLGVRAAMEPVPTPFCMAADSHGSVGTRWATAVREGCGTTNLRAAWLTPIRQCHACRQLVAQH